MQAGKTIRLTEMCLMTRKSVKHIIISRMSFAHMQARFLLFINRKYRNQHFQGLAISFLK